MALSKKTIVAISAAAAVVVLGVGLTVGLNAYFDHQARASFELAEADMSAAQRQHEQAEAALQAAVADAADAHARGSALFDVTDDTMLAEAQTKASLGTVLAKLSDAVDQTESDGVPAGEEANADTEAAPSSHQSNTPTPDSTPSDEPASREDLHTAAAKLRAERVTLRAQTLLLSQEATRLEKATDAVDQKGQLLLASAHAKATQTEVPELASEETKNAFAAAVAALEQPAANADLAALMQAYLDSWAAVVASNEEALQALDPASIEPTYIRGILVVNKTYALPSWFGDGLTAETVSAFDRMQAEAAAHGHHIYISSGFRSYWSQESIYNRYVAADGRAEADRYSARPGHSEHQSGLTFDLNTIDEAFAYTPEGEWVRDNAHRFGFVIRYPQGKEHITGYIWEPWHLRYLGVDVATELYSSGLSLEEYLGITSQYAD